MTPPRPGDLAHDLRNLVGLIRAITADLAPRLSAAGPAVLEDTHELDVHTRFAMDALRVVEQWDTAEPVAVTVGAWAWALRLVERRLLLGVMEPAPPVTVVVPQALAAGQALVAAMGGAARTLRVDPAPGGAVLFAAVTRVADPERLNAAIAELQAAGLAAKVVSDVPCRVSVG